MKLQKKIILLFIGIILISFNIHGQKGVKSRHTGIFNITEIGYLSSSNAYSSYAGRFRTSFGYFIDNKTSFGVGFGLDGYHNPIDINTAPLYIDIRRYLYNKPKTPFGFINVGKSIAISEIHEKGNFYSIGIGYQKNKILTSIAYNHQEIEFIDYNLSINSIAFNLGLLF